MNRTWLGVGFVALLALLLVLALTQGDDPPATTLMAAPTSTTAPTTTAAPTTTVPTTTAAPTTTQDLSAREAEVEALVKELELALWDALYRGDEQALADVIGGEALWNAVKPNLDTAASAFLAEPTLDSYGLTLVEILRDDADCIVTHSIEDTSAFLAEATETLITVVWPADDAPSGFRIGEHFGPATESSWAPWCEVEDRSWRP